MILVASRNCSPMFSSKPQKPEAVPKMVKTTKKLKNTKKKFFEMLLRLAGGRLRAIERLTQRARRHPVQSFLGGSRALEGLLVSSCRERLGDAQS